MILNKTPLHIPLCSRSQTPDTPPPCLPERVPSHVPSRVPNRTVPHPLTKNSLLPFAGLPTCSSMCQSKGGRALADPPREAEPGAPHAFHVLDTDCHLNADVLSEYCDHCQFQKCFSCKCTGRHPVVCKQQVTTLPLSVHVGWFSTEVKEPKMRDPVSQPGARDSQIASEVNKGQFPKFLDVKKNSIT